MQHVLLDSTSFADWPSDCSSDDRLALTRLYNCDEPLSHDPLADSSAANVLWNANCSICCTSKPWQMVLMWIARFSVDSSDDIRHHKAVKRSQRACAAAVCNSRHTAAVWVPHQLSWRRDGDAGRHGHRHAWSCVRPVCHYIAERRQQYYHSLNVRQQVFFLYFNTTFV